MKQRILALLRLRPVAFVLQVGKLYFSHHVSRAAAELSYFLILTFFPILICISSLISRLHLNPESIVSETQYILPQSVTAILQDYIRYIDNNRSTAMFLAGLTMAIFFAAAAVRGLMNIMQEIYGRTAFHGIRQWVTSILFSVLLLVVIYAAILIMVTGNRFFHTLGRVLGVDDLVEQFGTWQWLKYIALLALVLLFVMLIYRFSALLCRPRPPVLPGAAVTAVAISVASFVFSLWMGRSARYSLVYGSLTSVIFLLIWLYLCGNILIIGSLFNYVLYENRRAASDQ